MCVLLLVAGKCVGLLPHANCERGLAPVQELGRREDAMDAADVAREDLGHHVVQLAGHAEAGLLADLAEGAVVLVAEEVVPEQWVVYVALEDGAHEAGAAWPGQGKVSPRLCIPRSPSKCGGIADRVECLLMLAESVSVGVHSVKDVFVASGLLRCCINKILGVKRTITRESRN